MLFTNQSGHGGSHGLRVLDSLIAAADLTDETGKAFPYDSGLDKTRVSCVGRETGKRLTPFLSTAVRNCGK
jgi:hypothetical protein